MLAALALFTPAAVASDGVRELPLEDVVRSAEVIALVKGAAPCVTRETVMVPLSTEPPREWEWTESVERFQVVEIVHARGKPPSGEIAAIGGQAEMHFRRSVRYEVEGASRGMIHERYEGSLDRSEPLDGRTFVVFLDRAAEASDNEDPTLAAWRAAFGAHWQVIAHDDARVLRKVRRLIEKE